MAAKEHRSNDDQGVAMPPDGTESDDVGASTLDGVQDQRQSRPQQGVKVRRTRKGSVEVAFQEAPSGDQGDPRVSTADPEAEIQSMVDIDSVRPSLPKAIRGRLEVHRVGVHHDVCEDQVTSAIEGWCGDVNDAPGYQGEILKKWGGGVYEVKGIDRQGKPKAVRIELGGYSKPIPNTPHPPRDHFPPIDENLGFGFSGSPGFEPSQQRADVFQDQDGHFVATSEAAEPEEDLGWVWAPARNLWIWKGRGAPPSRPPRGLGVGASSQQSFNLDHSMDAEDKASRADWIREQEERRREEERARLAEEREDRRRAEERAREEARERREEERLRFEREKEERRAEEAQRREEAREQQRKDDERRREEREERRRDEERAREDRKAAAELARIAAEKQAEAMKETARIAADSAKETARLQSESNKHLFEILLKKSGDGGTKEVLDMGLRIAEIAQGNSPEKSTAAEVADAIKESAKPVSEAFRDSVLAIKGYPMAGQPLPLAGAGGAAPPQLSGPGAPAGPAPAQNEVQFQIASMQLVTYFVNCMRHGRKPSHSLFTAGCLAYDGLAPRVLEVESKLLLATPEIVVSEFEKGCVAIPQFANALPLVREACLSPQGRAWLQGMKDSIARERQARAQAQQAQQPQPATQPPAPAAPAAQGPSDGHVANPNDPRITGVDPTRPPILPN